MGFEKIVYLWHMSKSSKLIKSWIVTGLILAFMLFAFIRMAVVDHDYTGLGTLALFGFFIALAFILAKGNRSFKKLMKALPADHKLINTHVAAIDVGNFRFIYHIYVKDISSPIAKEYLSMSVTIPFPVTNELLPDEQVRNAIKQDLQGVMDSLHQAGDSTDENRKAGDDEGESESESLPGVWIGTTFFVEFPLKSVTEPFIAGLQNRILDIINKHNLQESEFATTHGLESGTAYRHYKGNLLQTALFSDFSDAVLSSEYKDSAPNHLGQYDSLFGLAEFANLQAVSAQDLGKYSYTVDNLAALIKKMFKDSRCRIKIEGALSGFAVNVTVPSISSASTYYLSESTGYWWFYSSGRLDRIQPMSMSDEATACDMLLRIISRFVSVG